MQPLHTNILNAFMLHSSHQKHLNLYHFSYFKLCTFFAITATVHLYCAADIIHPVIFLPEETKIDKPIVAFVVWIYSQNNHWWKVDENNVHQNYNWFENDTMDSKLMKITIINEAIWEKKKFRHTSEDYT